MKQYRLTFAIDAARLALSDAAEEYHDALVGSVMNPIRLDQAIEASEAAVNEVRRLRAELEAPEQ